MRRGDAPAGELVIELAAPLDLRRTLAPLAHGRGDPTIQLAANEAWLAHRTPAGAAALHLALVSRGRLRARAWGTGTDAALDGVGELVGLSDAPEALVPRHAVLRDLQRQFVGLRLPRTRRAFDALLPAILEQKITGTEARRVYRALLARYGQPSPGPFELRLPPAASVLAALPYYAFHPLGLERRRAEVIRGVARVGERMDASFSSERLRRLLLMLPGVGSWTAAEVLRVAHGDPDAVSVGDFHIPNLVAWALAGEARADDDRMLELLEPYRGQRGRVQRLLEVSGIRVPRFGPRLAPRRIAAI
ncbi:MAG: DNA-3-methyladenine glycosylase family protein [Candidatus Limnocylindria bacterium]